mmetsp:Transcript_45053/g.72336  ORF Transcript_45053/g.72336 Transcript_45053/m.72336 type:complete len:413 (+) Transcript_45053:85-1323(+)
MDKEVTIAKRMDRKFEKEIEGKRKFEALKLAKRAKKPKARAAAAAAAAAAAEAATAAAPDSSADDSSAPSSESAIEIAEVAAEVVEDEPSHELWDEEQHMIAGLLAGEDGDGNVDEDLEDEDDEDEEHEDDDRDYEQEYDLEQYEEYDEDEDDEDYDDDDDDDDDEDEDEDEDEADVARHEEAVDKDKSRMNYVAAFEPDELVDILLNARGNDVVSINVTERCNWTDYMIICTAKSPRHIRMLSGSILYAVKKRTNYVVGTKLKPSIEGADTKNGQGGDDHWMLVDCGSCVVHCFSAEARERYDLEGLWAPGKGFEGLEKRNPETEIMTIDSITVPDEGGEEKDGSEAITKEVEIDMQDMGKLEDYDEDYRRVPSADRTITDVEEEKVAAKLRRDKAKKGKFGSPSVKIDLD